MAHFYGTIKGQRGEASRLGSKSSGLETRAASWQGAVTVRLYTVNGVDVAEVDLAPHHGAGCHLNLYRGPVAGSEAAVLVDRSQCGINPCTCHDDSGWTAKNKARGMYPFGCSCGCKWSGAS